MASHTDSGQQVSYGGGLCFTYGGFTAMVKVTVCFSFELGLMWKPHTPTAGACYDWDLGDHGPKFSTLVTELSHYPIMLYLLSYPTTP